jgi:hypothetical protein
MRIEGYVSTGRVGSKVTFNLELEDLDLAELTPEEREQAIEDFAREAMLEHIEWNYTVVE